jgi:DNA invertase Pin-like site-specific DNA recombinase
MALRLSGRDWTRLSPMNASETWAGAGRFSTTLHRSAGRRFPSCARTEVPARDGETRDETSSRVTSRHLSGRGVLVGYARVSTQDQDTALQIDALKTAGCTEIFAEKASGAQRDRPQLAAALDSMRPGDTLVVWKLDRLARSVKQLVETVEDLAARRIGFRSLTEDMDTTTAGGTLIFNVFASLAEFERSIARERARAGLDAARARGRVGGRPAALNERDLQEARALLKDPSITVEQVAMRLGVGASTLYRHLPGGVLRGLPAPFRHLGNRSESAPESSIEPGCPTGHPRFPLCSPIRATTYPRLGADSHQFPTLTERIRSLAPGNSSFIRGFRIENLTRTQACGNGRLVRIRVK